MQKTFFQLSHRPAVVSFRFGSFSYLDFCARPPTRIASEMFSTFSCQNNPQLVLTLDSALRTPLAINEIRRINCEIFIFDVDSLPHYCWRDVQRLAMTFASLLLLEPEMMHTKHTKQLFSLSDTFFSL